MAKKDKKPDRRARPKIKAKKGGQRPRDEPRELAVFDPGAVEKVLEAMPDDDTLLSAADLLQGLAHPSRIKAVVALGVSELCVGDIAALCGLSLSATSTLLKQLRALGYLASRSAGKQIYYRISSRVPQDVLRVVFAATAAR